MTEPCPIVAEVRARLLQRAELGMGKYGTNLARDDLSEADWLEHARDEALDLANYLTVLLVRARKRAQAASSVRPVGVVLTEPQAAYDALNGECGHE